MLKWKFPTMTTIQWNFRSSNRGDKKF